jgi:hypothetical protein
MCHLRQDLGAIAGSAHFAFLRSRATERQLRDASSQQARHPEARVIRFGFLLRQDVNGVPLEAAR